MTLMTSYKGFLTAICLFGTVACSPAKTIEVQRPVKESVPRPTKPTTDPENPPEDSGSTTPTSKKYTFARLLCDTFGDNSFLGLTRSDATFKDTPLSLTVVDEEGRDIRAIADYKLFSVTNQPTQLLVARDQGETIELLSGALPASGRKVQMKSRGKFPWLGYDNRLSFREQRGGRLSLVVNKDSSLALLPDTKSGNHLLLNYQTFAIHKTLDVPYAKYWGLELSPLAKLALFGSVQWASAGTSSYVDYSVYDFSAQKLIALQPLYSDSRIEIVHFVTESSLVWREIKNGEVLVVGKRMGAPPFLITSLGSNSFKNFASVSFGADLVLAFPSERIESSNLQQKLVAGHVQLVFLDPTTLQARRETKITYPKSLLGQTIYNGMALTSFDALEKKAQFLFSAGFLGGLYKLDLASKDWVKVGGDGLVNKCLSPDFVWETQDLP